MYKQIIDRTDQPPEKCIERANDPFIVKSVIRIIPKTDIHPYDKYPACNKLNHSHYGGHYKEHEDLGPETVRIHARKGDK